MGLVERISTSVGIGVYRSGQMELVAAPDVVRFLTAVSSRGLRVLGLEGFRIVGDRLIPDMDLVADFSSISGSAASEESVAEALRFLSNVGGSGQFYDVILDDDVD